MIVMDHNHHHHHHQHYHHQHHNYYHHHNHDHDHHHHYHHDHTNNIIVQIEDAVEGGEDGAEVESHHVSTGVRIPVVGLLNRRDS